MTTSSWSEVFRDKRRELISTILALMATLWMFSHFVQWVERRPGAVLRDPLLELLNPVDFTWSIFLIIYGALLFGVLRLRTDPDGLLRLIRSYAILVLIRTLTMWLVPLDPPTDMILLVDPVVALSGADALTRDLFFSGHTATMCLLTYSMNTRATKIMMAGLTMLLAALLLIQHVHYSIDVAAAPLFAALAWRTSQRPGGWFFRTK